eukprot:jgi/Chrzof1/4686/Cz14g22230.t1
MGGACCICVRRYMSVSMPHFTTTFQLTSAQRQLSYCLLSHINLHMVILVAMHGMAVTIASLGSDDCVLLAAVLTTGCSRVW